MRGPMVAIALLVVSSGCAAVAGATGRAPDRVFACSVVPAARGGGPPALHLWMLVDRDVRAYGTAEPVEGRALEELGPLPAGVGCLVFHGAPEDFSPGLPVLRTSARTMGWLDIDDRGPPRPEALAVAALVCVERRTAERFRVSVFLPGRRPGAGAPDLRIAVRKPDLSRYALATPSNP